MRGPILIVARERDPLMAAFSRYAIQRRLRIWLPNRLDEISWSWQQSSTGSFVEVSDRAGAIAWNDRTLCGVWYRSLPRCSVPASLDEVDQRYVAAEIASSFTAAWLNARCPVIGIIPSLDSALADAGPEMRTELRRLGVSTLADHLGSFAEMAAKSDDGQRDVWITAARRSGWLGDLPPSSHVSCRDERADEIVVASPSRTDGRCVAIYVDSDLRLVSLSNRRVMPLPPAEIVSAVNVVREATRLRAGVCYFVRQPDGWVMVRVSAHIPGWLDARSNAWTAARLCGVFEASSSALPS